MTTYTIKVLHPKADNAGWDTAADTGMTYNDATALKAWCPAGSTTALRVGRLMAMLERHDGRGFKYAAVNGGTTILADLNGFGIPQES